uniref:Retrotransposon-like protein 1 n=1 Tax=Caenorhabditis elegans TaxID=6239 RepID=RETR1_CAEEL|nr:RecName: Full=Retrotransposon-like protein 1 [Caenorhabditis elegans]
MEVNEGQDTEGGSSRAQTLTPPPNPQQQLYDEEDLLRESMDTTEKTFENGFQIQKEQIRQHLQDSSQRGTAEDAETQKMKQFLDTNELHNMASDSWAMMREEIMEKRETNRDLNRQLKEKSEELMQKSQILVETTLKLKAVEEERDKRKKEEQFREADARSNNYARKDHGYKMHNIELKNEYTSTTYRCRYICRCALKPCMFNMTLVPEAHTPSPTQLYRMYCIMEKSGNRKIDPKQLMAMSSRPLPSPLQITLPDKMMDNLFKDMIGCSSLWTYVAELGWENSYNRYVDKLLNENCGDILNGPGTMLILADGLRLEDLPVSTKNCFVCTDYDEETLIALQKKCCRERFKMIVLVIPFTIDVELVDCWNRLIAKISEETKILVVSNMTPDELEDHALLVEFTSILQKCRRVDDGYLEIISLHDRLEAHPRKTLEMTALAGKVEYWKAVQTRAKEVGMEWKAFELKRCTSDTPVKNSDCEASTSMKSASTVRTFEDRMVKRGNHNRVYHHFTPYGRKK